LLKEYDKFRSAAAYQPAALIAERLVRAAREQRHQNHQVRQGEQPLIRLDSRCFRRPRDKAKMTALREVVQMVHANPREIGHLIIGENLLARFDGNHGPGPLSLRLPSTPLDAYGILRAALV